jgi:hypothetical protein
MGDDMERRIFAAGSISAGWGLVFWRLVAKRDGEP